MHDVGMSGWNLLLPAVPYFCFLLTQIYAEVGWNGSLLMNFGRISWNFWSVLFLTAYILTSLYILYLLCKPSEEGDNEWQWTITPDKE